MIIHQQTKKELKPSEHSVEIKTKTVINIVDLINENKLNKVSIIYELMQSMEIEEIFEVQETFPKIFQKKYKDAIKSYEL